MIATLATLAGLALSQTDPPALIPPKLLGAVPEVVADGVRRDAPAEVRLQFVVDETGAPSEIVVTAATDPDPRIAAAAVEAVSALRFSPATDGGTPIAARLRLVVQVGTSPTYSGLDRRAPEPTPGPPMTGDGILSGRVLERGTRLPLPGLPVLLPELNISTTTDRDGTFRFEGLPRRALRLEIPALDHEPVTETVTAGEQPQLFRLEKAAKARYESVVEAEASDATSVKISVEVAREIPGSSGDPLKVVEVLPGIARPAAAGPSAGQLSVRGSAPEDTNFYVDGLPVFQVFHFGGLYSVLQDEWIGDIDYRAGGFSAEYGEATGGLLGISFAPMKDDGVHGNVDINVYHASALVTGAVGGGWTVGGGFRRSYFDAFVPLVAGDAVSFTAAPRYYDYQARADYRPNSNVSLRLAVFGSDDTISLATKNPSDDDPSSRGFELSRSFHQVQAATDLRLAPGLSLYAGLGTSYQQFELFPSADTAFQLTFDPVTARSHVTWQALPNLSVRGGLWTTFTRFNVDASIPPPPQEGQPSQPTATRESISSQESGVSTEGALFAEATWQPVDRFDVVVGARVSGWLGNFDAVSFDPRVTLRYGWDTGTTLTAAAGWYHQAPEADETSVGFGTTTLDAEWAVQTSLGVKQSFGEWGSLEVTGFYKNLGQLVTASQSFAGSGGGGQGGGDRYTNDGTGYVVGGELLARLTSRWVDGWVSYTLSRSRRVDGPGQEERPFSFDQTHVLSVVAGVDLTHGWRFSSRLRYSTGNPSTPLGPGYFDSAADAYVPRETGPRLSERVDDFVQLDLRIDKTWIFDSWRLVTYLEVNNATNRTNIEQVGYNYNYTERQDIESLPLVPSFGVRGSF
jgi:hypothetical protein